MIKEIPVTTPFIRLDSFLKLCGAAETGGHAKMMIQNGSVTVNNEICTARGKKLIPDTVVSCAGQQFKVIT